MSPLIVNFDGRWDWAKLPVHMDCCVCPVSVPTVTLDAARSMLPTGASVAKYMPVAIESTTPLAFVGSARFRIVYLALTLLMSGKVEVVMSRVGLKLAV